LDLGGTSHDIPIDGSNTPPPLDVAWAAPPEWWNSDDPEVPEPEVTDKDVKAAEKEDFMSSPIYYVKCKLLEKCGVKGEELLRRYEETHEDVDKITDELYKEVMLQQRRKLKENKNKPLVPRPPDIPDPPITEKDQEMHRDLCQSFIDDAGSAVEDCFWQPMICAKNRIVREHGSTELNRKLAEFWDSHCRWQFGYTEYKKMLEEAYEQVIRQFKEQHNQQLPWQLEEGSRKLTENIEAKHP
jgi:hypothetical protein